MARNIAEGILGLFDKIIGGEDVEHHKPDPEGVFKAIDALKISPSQCIFIGDSVTDAQTANNAKIKFIASLTGTTTKNEFKEYPVDFFLDEITKLPSYLLNKRVDAPSLNVGIRKLPTGGTLG
jgi:phosphoglycolate phosphatase-like HAD superfamily hydrolase